MLTFKDYIVEAMFSDDDFTRILRAFERRLPKLLGSQVYRDGGPTGMQPIGGGESYLYFFDKSAFQVRAKGGHVYGVDVWPKYSINKGPAYTIDVSQLNSSTLIGAMGTLAKLIKSPSEGQIEVKALEESIALDEMAKRIGDDSFYQMVVKAYGPDGAKNVTWEQIKGVADQNDVLIPAYIRSQKIGRGRWDATPGSVTDVGSAPEKTAPSSTDLAVLPANTPAGQKKDSILFIKVTAQDPDSKKFISAANDKGAQRLYAQIQGALDVQPTEAEVKDPDTLYGHMAQLVEMACKGTLRSLLIYGGPGTGKTFTIMKTINDMGMVKGQDFQKLSGKASPIEIYKTLFMFRNKGLVVFDDLDSMWGNEDATNILKAALDTSPVREISWVSAQTINVSKMTDDRKEVLFSQIDRALNGETEPPEDDEDDEKRKPKADEDDEPEEGTRKKRKPKADFAPSPDKIKYPSSFEFKGRVIFISNLKKEEFDSAILSRSAKINMDLSPAQILDRMRKILPSLGGEDVPIDQKEELLDHLLKMHRGGQITQVTMREFTKGLDIVRSGAPNWRDLVQYA